jgi:hypothetical protein
MGSSLFWLLCLVERGNLLGFSVKTKGKTLAFYDIWV